MISYLLPLWLKFITFMVSQIITFMVKILLHLILVSDLLHLWLIITFLGDTSRP